MNSFYERIELLVNRCGQTISDISGDIQSEAGTAEIIDRFEWVLENVCNERDYLAYRLRRYRDCQSCERANECERTPDHCLGWTFGGVPEDWSVDDE